MVSTAQQPATDRASSGRGRRIGSNVLLGISTVLAIVAIVAIWANRQLLNADNWAATSTSLLQSPTIRSATANYLVDQLYANVDVAGTIDSALPPRLRPLAAPVAAGLRSGEMTKARRTRISGRVLSSAWPR